MDEIKKNKSYANQKMDTNIIYIQTGFHIVKLKQKEPQQNRA